jgi:hypothetical protein
VLLDAADRRARHARHADIGSIERVRVLFTSGWFLVIGLLKFRQDAS